MLNIFKSRRALLAELQEAKELYAKTAKEKARLYGKCAMLMSEINDQKVTVSNLNVQIADRETLLRAAYERLDKAKGPKRNAKGQFVGKE